MSPSLAFKLSRRVTSTVSPPIPQAYKWAAAYVAKPTRPLIDMAQGVPGIPPPPSLLKALAEASSAPESCGYCPANGEISLRKALAQEMKVVYGKNTDVTADDICLTAGCNLAFSVAVTSLADAGDEVILPVPWYFNNQMTLNLLGVKTVPLPTLSDDGFMPSVDLCERLITSRTKAIALVSPNNPTGAVYPPSLLASFANLARKHNIGLIIDETYRDLIPGPAHNLFSPSALGGTDNWSWRSNIIHLFSFSKSYCIPGHRLGAIIASPSLVTHLKTILDSWQICAPRPPQLALASVLPTLRSFINTTALSLHDRHTLFKKSLPQGWKVGAQGGYFAFVKHPYAAISATEVSKGLAQQMGVVTLPAEFFSNIETERVETGMTGVDMRKDEGRWIRFSVANVDDEKVRQVCKRLEESKDVFGWEVDY